MASTDESKACDDKKLLRIPGSTVSAESDLPWAEAQYQRQRKQRVVRLLGGDDAAAAASAVRNMLRCEMQKPNDGANVFRVSDEWLRTQFKTLWTRSVALRDRSVVLDFLALYPSTAAPNALLPLLKPDGSLAVGTIFVCSDSVADARGSAGNGSCFRGLRGSHGHKARTAGGDNGGLPAKNDESTLLSSRVMALLPKTPTTKEGEAGPTGAEVAEATSETEPGVEAGPEAGQAEATGATKTPPVLAVEFLTGARLAHFVRSVIPVGSVPTRDAVHIVAAAMKRDLRLWQRIGKALDSRQAISSPLLQYPRWLAAGRPAVFKVHWSTLTQDGNKRRRHGRKQHGRKQHQQLEHVIKDLFGMLQRLGDGRLEKPWTHSSHNTGEAWPAHRKADIGPLMLAVDRTILQVPEASPAAINPLVVARQRTAADGRYRAAHAGDVQRLFCLVSASVSMDTTVTVCALMRGALLSSLGRGAAPADAEGIDALRRASTEEAGICLSSLTNVDWRLALAPSTPFNAALACHEPRVNALRALYSFGRSSRRCVGGRGGK